VSETPAEYNAMIIAEFRANQGRVGGMWEATPLLLLHHTGAKSGKVRVNPVAYLPDSQRYLVWAANGGAPNNPTGTTTSRHIPTQGSRLGARPLMSSPHKRPARSASSCS